MNAPELRATAAAAHTATGAAELERLLARPFTPADLMQGDALDRIERIAERMAKGKVTVPEHLRGNVGDCMAIATQAMLWNMDPFVVAQKTHIVSGRLGYEAQLVNAVLQNSGAIRGLPHYEYRGDNNGLECRVGCVPRGESEVRWGEWLAISAVTTKNSPLWKTNPKQQMGYLQVKSWARAFAPGAILGVYTTDELGDVDPLPRTAQTHETEQPPARQALPPYDHEKFEKNLPGWQKLIDPEAGKTASALLAMLSTKATFSEEQKARILSLKKAEPEAPAVDPFVAEMDAAEGAAQ